MGKLHPNRWEALGTLLEASGRAWETWGSSEGFWEVLGVSGKALGSPRSFWQGLGDSWVNLGSSWRPLESSGKESWDNFENPSNRTPSLTMWIRAFEYEANYKIINVLSKLNIDADNMHDSFVAAFIFLIA
jgi:hypothetical protein